MANGVSQLNVALTILVLILLFYIFFLYSRPRPIQSNIYIHTTPTTDGIHGSSTMNPGTNARGVPIAHSLPFNKPYVSTLTYRDDTAILGSKPNATDELNTYYTPARRGIPTDFTMDSCSCPFAKPQSTDLPMPSLPTCLLLEKSSYKLSDF